MLKFGEYFTNIINIQTIVEDTGENIRNIVSGHRRLCNRICSKDAVGLFKGRSGCHQPGQHAQ